MRKALGRHGPKTEITPEMNAGNAFRGAKVLEEEGKIRLFGIATRIIEGVLTHGFYRKEGNEAGFYKVKIALESSFQFILFVVAKLEEEKLSDTVNSDLEIEGILREAAAHGLVQISRDYSKEMIQRTKRVAKAQNIIISTLSTGFVMDFRGKPKYHSFEIKEDCWDKLLRFVVSKIKAGRFSGVYDYRKDLPEILKEAEKRGLIEIKQKKL